MPRFRRPRFTLKWLLVLPALVAAFVVGWQERTEEQRSAHSAALAEAQQVRESVMKRFGRVRIRPMPTAKWSPDELQMMIDRADSMRRMEQFQNHPLNR